MKNEEQRIWNKSELEAHPDWIVGRVAYLGTWINDKSEYCITADMVGQTVQWCEEQGFSVTPEMIAKTEIELIQEAVTQANDKLKERLDKGEIGITLENGTTLKVGEKYRLESWDEGVFAEILFIGEQRIFCKYENENEFSWDINKKWLTYTEPKEEPKPLEGYQKWYGVHKNEDIIKIRFAKKKPDNINIFWYTEQEAIDLGLVI